MAEGLEDAPDRIRLTGITATGYHGVFDHERRDGQLFSADVVLHVDTRAAAAADRLELTVDYARFAERVAQVLAGPPVYLLETVAERVAALALAHESVVAVDVVVHKPQAAVPGGDIAVQVYRDRSRPPVVGVPAAAPPAALGTAVEPPAAPAPQYPAAPAPAFALPPAGEPFPVAPAVAPAEPDRLDLAPDSPVEVVLALGSNVGASEETLRRAIGDLSAVTGLEVTAVGPLTRTAPVGGPEQEDFLNTVVLGRTVLSPRALLHACQAVESAHGRGAGERWGPRTLDVDLILHGSTVASAADLELPHPRAHQRAFVLEPWAHVDPDAVLPGLGGGPVSVLAETAPDREGIRWIDLQWWGG